MSTFGLGFVVLNDICQELPDICFADGPAIHHATIRRGLKEYIVFRERTTNKIYIEEVERHRATFKLMQIKDDNEWRDIMSFCEGAGFLNVAGETKHAN